MKEILILSLIILPIIILASVMISIPTPQPVIVLKEGCSYYEIYHSRRSDHYEYIHYPDCTNKQHKISLK